MILIDDYPRALLVKMESFRAPLMKKWLELGN